MRPILFRAYDKIGKRMLKLPIASYETKEATRKLQKILSLAIMLPTPFSPTAPLRIQDQSSFCNIRELRIDMGERFMKMTLSGGGTSMEMNAFMRLSGLRSLPVGIFRCSR